MGRSSLPSPFLILALTLLLFLVPRGAAAGHDEEMALSGAVTYAHDRLDVSGLRRMMSPAERQRFDKAGVAEHFEQHLRGLGITQLVRCTLLSPGDPQAPSALNMPLDEYRCQVSCQHGSYAVRALMAPPRQPPPGADPLPRPGSIERLWLASPLLDRTPWPWFPRELAPLWLGVLFAVALLLIGRAVLLLSGIWQTQGTEVRREEGRELAPVWFQARQQLVLFLRVLPALAVGLLLLPMWWRFGPAPLWGHALFFAFALGLVALLLGVVLFALGDFLRGVSPESLLPALLVAVLAVLPSLRMGTGSALLDPRAPGAASLHQQVGYRLPLLPGPAPAYVRRSDGPLVEFLYRHPDGQSCHGGRLKGCRSVGAAVLAPAAGRVVEVGEGYPDQEPGQRDREHPEGNYLILRHGEDLSLLSHLLRGSITVHPGQQVHAGEVVGRIGNSGDGDEPHLSLQRWTAPQPVPGRRPDAPAGAPFDPESASGFPPVFSRYLLHGMAGATPVEMGTLQAGQEVSALDPAPAQ